MFSGSVSHRNSGSETDQEDRGDSCPQGYGYNGGQESRGRGQRSSGRDHGHVKDTLSVAMCVFRH